VVNPSYGSVLTADLSQERKNGDVWNAQAHTWFASSLPAGRQPFTAVLLQGTLSGGVTFGFNTFELGSATSVTSSSQQQR
jgi:hypothetical protein